MSTVPNTGSKFSSEDESVSRAPTASLNVGEETVTPAPSRSDVASMLHPPEAEGEIGRIGGYRVIRVLGQGGMGVVFLGEDVALGRMVAIKAMLPTPNTESTTRERFLREARAAAMIKDDHVVTIHQVGEDNGVPFLVMELLVGESLAERINRDVRLPPKEVVRIGRELLQGLAAAHAQGLQHRDVKPANIWLEAPSGRIKLLDFGLARPAARGTELTSVGAILGTPAYMPPEQARGQATDARSDLFSAGVVLYQLATGERPFRGDTAMSLLLALAEQTPSPPRQLCPDVPTSLSNLIMQLLAKKMADRPPTAHAVLASLDKIDLERPIRRSKWPMVAVPVVVVLGLMAGLVYLIFGARDGADGPVDRPTMLSPATVSQVTSPNITTKTTSTSSTAIPSTSSDPPMKSDPPIRSSIPIDNLKRDTHVPSGWSKSPDQVVAIAHETGEKFTVVAFSADGKHLAVGTRSGLIKLWDFAAWKSRTLHPIPKQTDTSDIVQVEFSPNNKFVAAATDRTHGAVVIFDVDRGVQTGRDTMQYADRSFAFSRDAAMFATAGTKNEDVRLYDLGADGKLKKRSLDSATLSTASVVFTPGSDRLIAFGANRNSLRTWDPSTGKTHPAPGWWPKELGANPHSVVFSANGDRIAMPTDYHPEVYSANTRNNGKLRSFDPQIPDRVRDKFRSDTKFLTNVAFGADNNKVVAGYADGTVRICQFGAGNGTWRTVCSFPEGRRVAHVAFSPEGRHVAAVSGGDVYLIRLP